MTTYRELTEMPARLYAIGDIHACLEETEILLTHLKEVEDLSAKDLVVFVGDYIDRGANSSAVLDLLIEFKKQFPATIFLCGNHEEMLLSYLEFEGRSGPACLFNGGLELLKSYGIALNTDPEAVKDVLLSTLPESHKQFFSELENYVITPKYIIAHAGLNPLRDMRYQFEADLFWIRNEFIANLHYFKHCIVFGHTPFEDIVFHLPYKIGIDTGLVYGNKLSCVEVVHKKILQIKKGAKQVDESSFPG